MEQSKLANQKTCLALSIRLTQSTIIWMASTVWYFWNKIKNLIAENANHNNNKHNKQRTKWKVTIKKVKIYQTPLENQSGQFWEKSYWLTTEFVVSDDGHQVSSSRVSISSRITYLGAPLELADIISPFSHTLFFSFSYLKRMIDTLLA